jgi:14-3-3 protein epsilon
MKVLGGMPQELSREECNLFCVALNNTVGPHRASCSILRSIEKREQAKGNERNAEFAREYRSKVEAELDNICTSMLELFNSTLLANAPTLLERKAGIYLCCADFKTGVARQEAKENCLKTYEEALSITSTGLAVIQLIHLQLFGDLQPLESTRDPGDAREMFRKKFVDADAHLQDMPVLTLTCNHIVGTEGGVSSVYCSTMDGDVVAVYEVPQDHDPFGAWLGKEASQTVTRNEECLCLMASNGDILWRERHGACEVCTAAIDELEKMDDYGLLTVLNLSQSYVALWTNGFCPSCGKPTGGNFSCSGCGDLWAGP